MTNLFWSLLILESSSVPADTNLQNRGVHNNSQISSQAQGASRSNQRKPLDKGDKQEDQHNKHNSDKLSQSEKNDKKYAHTNGNSVSSNDLQLIERIR